MTLIQCSRSLASVTTGERLISAISQAGSSGAVIESGEDRVGSGGQHRRRATHARVRTVAKRLGDTVTQPRDTLDRLHGYGVELTRQRRLKLAPALQQPRPVRVRGTCPKSPSCCLNCSRLCHQTRPKTLRTTRRRCLCRSSSNLRH